MFSVTNVSPFPADNLGFLEPVPSGATGKPDERQFYNLVSSSSHGPIYSAFTETVFQSPEPHGEGVTSLSEESAGVIVPESAELNER
jgi:hypothetical protein